MKFQKDDKDTESNAFNVINRFIEISVILFVIVVKYNKFSFNIKLQEKFLNRISFFY